MRTSFFIWLSFTALGWCESTLEPAHTAWMLLCTALVLLMTPALGFFYSGMVRSKNALNTLMMSVAALGVVGLTWVLLGYSLAFSPQGNLEFANLQGVGLEAKGKIPHLLFMAYQGTFAIITAALVSGAIVERMRFPAYLCFIGIWSLLVYAPVAHWVWGGGWLGNLGALDFAGGTVVHINAGIAALVLALHLGPRKEEERQNSAPHHIPSVLLGAALLWFGWFGFNAGSALEANSTAALAFVNTMLAPMAALTTWMILDYVRCRQVTAIGSAIAIVVGLVSVTPAAGFVGPVSALALGCLATFPSYLAILWRHRLSIDDSLDVFAGHGLGGISGAILTGVFASTQWGPVQGSLRQILIQLLAVVVVAVYSAVATWIVLKLVSCLTHLRANDEREGSGLDLGEHGERAYNETTDLLGSAAFGVPAQ